jgi:hypothetical protein
MGHRYRDTGCGRIELEGPDVHAPPDLARPALDVEPAGPLGRRVARVPKRGAGVKSGVGARTTEARIHHHIGGAGRKLVVVSMSYPVGNLGREDEAIQSVAEE